MAVPPHAALSPNTPVAVVLKEDQPTGRRVRGVVSQVLTKGDHHRGVKVRLTDGRVGRVQQIFPDTDAAPTGSNEAAVSAPNGTDNRTSDSFATSPDRERWRGGRGNGGRGNGGRGRGGRGGRGGSGSWRGRESAPRNGDGEEQRGNAYDLTAFIKEGRPWGRGRRQQPQQQQQQQEQAGSSRSSASSVEGTGSPSVLCPVCGEFEGDEQAVQHHVESHFS
ncbi:hypothetical protein TWF696_000917 [Orbilia brochopaga]|uniref:Uncharacterized protein n=1 Tax=Orbilia brochopaga TaxID=3140254 RepID=A0AAV9VF26_9PEZI